MTSTLSHWYHNQYAVWNRTRRMQASPYRTEAQASRVARPNGGNPGDAVINMGDLLGSSSPQAGDKKKQDALFGPSIGVVNPGPDWADQKLEPGEKAQPRDVLTPDLVNTWVEKSKQASQPTTTLQALVNLKRPTLRLSPISQAEPEEGVSQPQQHGIEFQFDCDAPKCAISLRVIAVKDSTSKSFTEVYHAVVDGGFGRTLKLEEGATLDLAKLDPSAQPNSDPSLSAEKPVVPEITPADPPSSPVEPATPKRRFTLRIRRRTNPNAEEDTNRVSVAGPALQVVDAEIPVDEANLAEREAKEKNEDGVKVFIKLEALDADAHSLVCSNSQTTYLHIVRVGPAPASEATDIRPWVVRVVKREATIGAHTFHLHEIYGLTSHAPETQEHVYPPALQDSDDPTSECLLCLSSPREVVLLPCRHLVACKECAVNMVEFGAGGQLVHTEETPAVETNGNTVAPGETPGEGSGAANEAEGGEAAPRPSAPAPSRPPASRRKRKAKGWFCPVCRQPYTSLLRISTTPLAKKLENEEIGPQMTTTETTSVQPSPVSPQSPNTSRPGFLRVIAARMTGSESNSASATETGREAV